MRLKRELGPCEAPRLSLCESPCPARLGLTRFGSIALALVWCVWTQCAEAPKAPELCVGREHASVTEVVVSPGRRDPRKGL